MLCHRNNSAEEHGFRKARVMDSIRQNGKEAGFSDTAIHKLFTLKNNLSYLHKINEEGGIRLRAKDLLFLSSRKVNS